MESLNVSNQNSELAMKIKKSIFSDTLSEILGKEFITLYTELKQTEHDAYQKVISKYSYSL